MIEILSEERCTSCNQCVRICPTNVFQKVENGIPVIARQSDCQTCFMCELYCPVDAIYVAPNADGLENVQESTVIEDSLLGSYRESVGWGKGRKSTASDDESYLVFRQTRLLAQMQDASRK
ncbi:4Fe-4S binding protein [Paenibacillus sp. NPDC058071]|uniref:4Fe-4S binding protein n=1 Tax=Paenibacillus sp. NPDC058071 TaxID=3346326 RepID=UPI0036DB46F3